MKKDGPIQVEIPDLLKKEKYERWEVEIIRFDRNGTMIESQNPGDTPLIPIGGGN